MNDPRIRAILDELATLSLLLLRPVVQQQIVAFLVVTLVAWLIPIPYRLFIRWLARRSGVAQIEASVDRAYPISWRVRIVRILRAFEFVLFPIIGLLLGGVAVGYLSSRGAYRTGSLSG